MTHHNCGTRCSSGCLNSFCTLLYSLFRILLLAGIVLWVGPDLQDLAMMTADYSKMIKLETDQDSLSLFNALLSYGIRCCFYLALVAISMLVLVVIGAAIIDIFKKGPLFVIFIIINSFIDLIVRIFKYLFSFITGTTVDVIYDWRSVEEDGKYLR